jgi:uncharacterized protein (TIGR01777 family)
MQIAITGSTGLIGTALSQHLEQRGDSVIRVMRRSPQQGEAHEVFWEPEQGVIDASALEGVDVLVHLAGENLSARRWTPVQKERILYSRTRGTSLLAKTLTQLQSPPKVWISASAIGYYGNRPPGEVVDEDSPRGEGFLAEVTERWEASTRLAQEAGIRVVHLRFGIVLSERGGALAKMLPVYRLGLGGRIGSGDQMMSWVVLEEIPPVILHVLDHDNIQGPVNVVSPEAVSNQVFTRTLGKVLKRPAFFPLPAFAARLVFGEMGEELLLQGCHVRPTRLSDSGYRFRQPALESALRGMLR